MAKAEASKVSAGGSKKESGGLLSMLTVEPILVIHMSTAILAFMSFPDLLLKKACRVDLAYSDQVCTALESSEGAKYPEQDAEVQKVMGSVMMWRAMVENLFPVVLVCLIGAWSDKFGRKIPMLVVIGSFIIQHLGLVLCALDTKMTGSATVGLVSSLIVSLAGNNATFGMAIFSYVSDTTPKDKLSQRTAVTGSCFFLGITIGLGLGGVLASSTLSFAQIFLVAAVLESVAFLWLLFFIPNFIREPKAIKGISSGQMLREVFNSQHLVDAISSVFKKRKGNDRIKLLLLLLCHSLVMAPLFGEGGVMYLFSRLQFNWDAGAFSTFMTYKTIVGFIGNFVSMIVLTQKLKFSDPGVGIIACASQLVASVMFAVAGSPFIMYLGPIVSIFSGSITSVARSIIFKIVPGNETGKVNSFIGSLEALTPLVIAPAYSLIYTSTFEQLPGGFFFLSAAFMVPPIFVYLWLLGDKNKVD